MNMIGELRSATVTWVVLGLGGVDLVAVGVDGGRGAVLVGVAVIGATSSTELGRDFGSPAALTIGTVKNGKIGKTWLKNKERIVRNEKNVCSD